MKQDPDFLMKSITPDKYKHMLWKDECGDDFLLLKYAEVYRYSKDTLRLHIWSKKYLSLVRSRGWILNERSLDEQFTVVEVDNSNLESIIQLGAFKRRPDAKGAWIKRLVVLLAHKRIVPVIQQDTTQKKPKPNQLPITPKADEIVNEISSGVQYAK